ncbi:MULTISPECIES: FadR/GntR family transcriptional regulator [unclassified Sinorhizobium]|uniref:FadR/GntR family transcriptional regulator n=1 Tax=unclassified Sinorhizobium TaxID=2613772 RepID=UPI003524E30E
MHNGILHTQKTGSPLRTSHSQVVDELGKDIVSGQFPVGAPLPGDSDLVERFGVSRTVLRESMKTLAAKGLIVPRARVGTKVTEKSQWNMFDSDVLNWHFDSGVDQDFLLHLYDVRLAFEPFAAALAAERATSAERDALRLLAREMGKSSHSSRSLAAVDLRFHLAIAEASHNPFMRTVGSLIEAALVGMFRVSTPPSQNGFSDISQTHMRIIDAIANHDGRAAYSAMESVIQDGRERVLEAFATEGRLLRFSSPWLDE